MSDRRPGFELAAASAADVPQLVELIGELAQFEHLTHLLECTEARLHAALFGPRPEAEALVAFARDAGSRTAAGFALYFHNYSTFLGRKGLYLEDLYVRAQYRGKGCGTLLLTAVARLARERGCGRFEWSVLDWNTPAQRFYQSLGATILPDWRIVRVTGDALERLAARAGEAADG